MSIRLVGFAAAATLFLLSLPNSGTASAVADVDIIAIDVDTSGNTATSVTAINQCRGMPGVGSSIDVDVVIDEVPPFLGFPNGGGTFGYGFNILYNPAVVEVTAKAPIATTSLIASSGATFLTSLSNSVPDADGDFKAVELDASGNDESGEGTLLRLTFTAVGIGISPITLTDTDAGNFDGVPDVYSSDTSEYTFGSVVSGMLYVGVSNPGPPQCNASPLFGSVGGAAELLVSHSDSEPSAGLWVALGIGAGSGVLLSAWVLSRRRVRVD